MRAKIQSFGRFLSGMVMPNIGAFIAWGLITAFFIPTGWIPNEHLGTLVDPMITYLLPLLIGYTGGSMIHGTRGGVVGAVATMGIIVGADMPMFLGAMLIGPLGGYAIKKFDEAIQDKIPAGFEMLVNNFSAGIIGMLLTLLSYIIIGPVVLGLNKFLTAGVEAIVNAGLLPLVSIFIEPGKILFLNNAINHGILGPLGVEQVAQTGKSIFFLLETNPGPGLGVLLAYWLVGKGAAKESAPGAIIIHFFGGIHEIYFPYVLMNPILIIAVILGGASGIFTFSLLGAGLVATPSPGSIFAELAMTPKGGYFPVLAGIFVSALVSFAASVILLRKFGSYEDESIYEAQEKVDELKGKKAYSAVSKDQPVRKIAFACDAGMGSSAMGASILRKKINEAGLKVQVINTAINEIPKDADIVICHKELAERVKAASPKAEHIFIETFINNPVYDEIVENLKEQ